MTYPKNAEAGKAAVKKGRHEHHNELGSKDRVDRWGAILGFACAIHCAITPFSFIFAPIIGIGSLWTVEGEALLLFFAVLFTISSLLSAYKAESRNSGKSSTILSVEGTKIISVFVISWAILAVSIFLKVNEHNEISSPAVLVEANKNDHSEHDGISADGYLNKLPNPEHSHSFLSLSFAVLGGFGLTTGHILNLRRRRKEHESCCHHQ